MDVCGRPRDYMDVEGTPVPLDTTKTQASGSSLPMGVEIRPPDGSPTRAIVASRQEAHLLGIFTGFAQGDQRNQSGLV
jgi:hypothetical protein